MHVILKSSEVHGVASDLGATHIQVTIHDGGLMGEEEAMNDAGFAGAVRAED
jgi:hypothetical protein